MPYIAIKAYSKDDKIKKEIAEEINKIFLEKWGCPQSAISISFEEFAPDDWNNEIRKGEMEQKLDKMFILDGEKKF